MTDEDERTLELPSHAAPRCERCLWLGMRLASLKRYILYNDPAKQFVVSEYALMLEQGRSADSHQSTSVDSHVLYEQHLVSEEELQDTEMPDAGPDNARSLVTESDYVMVDKSSIAQPSAGSDR